MIKKMLAFLNKIEQKKPVHIEMIKHLQFIQTHLAQHPDRIKTAEYAEVIKKQSLDSAANNIRKLYDNIKAQYAVEAIAADTKPVKRGYYTTDIYQEWIDEDNPEFNEADYKAYRKCCSF